MKDLLTAALEARELCFQCIDFLFGVDQRLRERPAAAPFTNEVQEICEPPLFGGEFRFLQANRLRDVAVERLDFRGDALKDAMEMLGCGELGADRPDDDLFHQGPADQ